MEWPLGHVYVNFSSGILFAYFSVEGWIVDIFLRPEEGIFGNWQKLVFD